MLGTAAWIVEVRDIPASGSMIEPMNTQGTGMKELAEGTVALITGGGSGIGRAIAERFAGAGAAVALCGRRQEVVAAAAAAISEAGGRACAICGDVSRRDDAARMVAETVEAFGALNVLINNAGISRNGALEAMSEDEIEAVIDIDLKGPIFVTRAALPHLTAHPEAGGGAVVNISSSVTRLAVKNYAVYSAAKAGLDMLTRCLALDLAAARVRVNAICPGVVETPIFRTMMPAEQVAPLLDQFAADIPLGRVGQPADVADLALYLASPRAAWITGAVIPVDGGQSLGLER